MSSPARESLLINPEEVGTWALGSYVPVDASWFMHAAIRRPKEEFEVKRLPNARFFDLDKVASQHPLGLPHMMPDNHTFADALESLGIDRGTTVVLYDTHGVFSSPRALFTFKAFGHPGALVLNGGLPAWEEQGLPVETEPPSAPWKSSYKPVPQLDASVIRSYEQMVDNSQYERDSKASELVLDARAHPRYTGETPEPRDIPSGHIPNSFSLPFSTLLEQHDKGDRSYTTMLSPEKLEQAIRDVLGPSADAVLAGQRPIVTTCGSGMTAAIIWLALQELGIDASVYDESWMGYAARKSSKIATGDE
ncbi:Rhodanese-like protein [Dacryopinax primogenitus]|uniref:Rhodanese-like protein n=1 Tax=Dacryopinax primogenitus (strain DJM 731) TaxID=1858805 RepID=M5FQU5_DACPD|nr:Rhodanese-like protein [Dacryopinax primogenitus]EJT97953.1 Rhodanese-like protein [Dacryopinax primogenitus]